MSCLPKKVKKPAGFVIKKGPVVSKHSDLLRKKKCEGQVR